MKQATQSVWTLEDWTTNLCSKEEVGKPKHQELSATPEATIAELPLATMSELKQAALRVARGKMGYDEFLLKNPQFHQKFLLSMAKEQQPQERPNIEVNISWLNSDRLSYKAGSIMTVDNQGHPAPTIPLAQHLVDKLNSEDVAFRALSSGEALSTEVQDIPWKEDESTEYQKAHREFDKP